MMKNDGGYNLLKTSLIVVLCFILAFAPVVGEVAPALASAAGKAADAGTAARMPLNLLGGTASVWGAMLSAASAGEEAEAVDEVVFDDLRDNAYILLDELLNDERLKNGLSEALARLAGNGGGTTLEDVVIGVLTDEGLRDLLSGVLASYLRLEEGSAEREFFQQITLDLFALLQDDSAGSFKAFLNGALGEFLEQPDVKNLISDVIGVATGRLGGIIEDLQEQNVLDEVPNMFKLWWEDFLNRTTGEGADEAMAAVVLGIIENAGVISEDFARALEEDENFKIAMEHLSDAVTSQLMEPLMDLLQEELGDFLEAINPPGWLSLVFRWFRVPVGDFLEAINPPGCGAPDCEGFGKCPNCPPRDAGMMGPMRLFLDMLMDSECATCDGNEFPGYIGTTSLTPCPNCPDNLGTVLKRIGSDLNANIAQYADSAMGEIIPADVEGAEIEPSDALVKAELGAFLMHWADNLIALIGNPETGKFLMEPLMGYFTSGEGKEAIDGIMATLNENFMRVYELLSDEESPFRDIIREKLSYPLFGAKRYEGEYEGECLMDKLKAGLGEIVSDVLDEVKLDDDVSIAAADFSRELDLIIRQVFPAYFVEEEDEEPSIEASGDLIDNLINSLTTFQSFADPEGEEVLLYELAGDISAYMGMICDDPACDCGGLPRAECMANKLVARLLDGVVDGIGAICVDPDCPVEGCSPTTPCESCKSYCTTENPCPACLQGQERAAETAAIRAGLLSVARLDQFYKDLLGPREPEYEYQYEVTDETKIMDIVLAVFKEILGGEEYASFLEQVQGEGGWKEELLKENKADTGLLDYGRRLVGAGLGFLDRIFAPLLKLIYPRRYVYDYDDAEQRRLENMVTGERITSSLRWIIAPLKGMLTESKLAAFAVDPENPGEYLTFPDFLIDEFLGYEYGGNTGLGILASPERLTAAADFASTMIGSEDLKALSAEYFARSVADPERWSAMLDDVTGKFNPLTGDIKITDTVNELIEGFLTCPGCEGAGCPECGGSGKLEQLDISLRDWIGILRGGSDSLTRIGAMLEDLAAECIPCGGTGLIDGEPCERCGGTGRPRTDYDCPFCSGAGCAECGGSGKARPSLVIPNIPALLLEGEASRRAVGDYQAATIGPSVEALAKVLKGQKARQIVYDLASEAVHILIDGVGAVVEEIYADEHGELQYLQEMMVEIFTFGDLPAQINALLAGFLRDPGWLGYCEMTTKALTTCSSYDAVNHERKNVGCQRSSKKMDRWNEPVPRDADGGLALGTYGGGLEYLLRLSLYYSIWKPFPYNPPDDPHAVSLFNWDGSEHAGSQMPSGWGRFWTVKYTKEACAFDLNASDVAHGAQIGIHRFLIALREWLRGEGSFTGSNPQNPAVLQRPAEFLPTYVENFYRKHLTGEFVPDAVEVIVSALKEVLTYEDPLRGTASDIVTGWLMPILFTNPADPTNVSYDWLLGDIADILVKDYGDETANLTEMLKDVVIGVPDAQGIREMKMLDALADMLKYDPVACPPPGERGHPPVWLLEEHVGTTFSNILTKFADFLYDGWYISMTATPLQGGGDLYLKITLDQPVDEETIRIFRPCGACEKCTADPPLLHECLNPSLEARDVLDPCTCENCLKGKSCLHPTGTFTGSLVKAGGPRNDVDYDAREIELSINGSPGDELIISWMPGLITYLELQLGADQLRGALKLPEAADPGEAAPFDEMIYNNILKYIRHIDPGSGTPLDEVVCQFCKGTGCRNCNGGVLINSASDQLSAYLLNCATCGGDGDLGGLPCPDCDGGMREVSTAAPGFRAGYIIEDIPSRLIVDLLAARAEGAPEGAPSRLAKYASEEVIAGLCADTLMNYRLGSRFLSGIREILASDSVFNALAGTISAFFSDLLETFIRRVTSFGGFLAGSAPAAVRPQSPDADEHDYDPAMLRAMPSAGVDSLALLAGVRAPEVPVPAVEIETAEATADAQLLADAIIKALKKMDTALIDEFINAALAEEPFKESLRPVIGLLGEILGDENLAEVIGAVLSGNMQDGRLDDDIGYIFNTAMNFLADEEINKISRQFVYSVLNSKEILGDPEDPLYRSYVDNLTTEGVEIGFALLRNMVENVLLVQYAENPKVPLEKTEIVKLLAKQFVSTARKEFEGYSGFPGYEQQFKQLLTDPRLADLLQFFGQLLAESGIGLGVDLLEDDRTLPILGDIFTVVADYALSGLEGIFGDSELTPIVFECVDRGIRNTSADHSYKFVQESVNDLIENLIYEEGALSRHLSVNLYKVMEHCGDGGYNGKLGVCDAKCRISNILAPETNLVESLHPQLAVVPPELLIDVLTDWLMYGGGRPGSGTMADWARNVAAQLRPELIYNAADPGANTLAKAYQGTQDFMLNLLDESHPLGGKPAILNRIRAALERYPLQEIAAAIEADPRLNPGDDYYIQRDLVAALIDILPLEQLGNILNIPVYTEREAEEFTAATFPPAGWSRTTPTANRWERDAVRGRTAPGAAKFTGTERPLLTGQTLLEEQFTAAMFPPPGWKVEVKQIMDRVGNGWHKHDHSKGWHETASMVWVDDKDWRKQVYDGNSPKGIRPHHAILYSPWFTFDTGSGTLTFRHKKITNEAARFTKAHLGVEYREDGEIKRHLLKSYTEAEFGSNNVFSGQSFTIPASFAGESVRLYFDFEGSYNLVGNNDIRYWKWVVDDVKVTGNRYGAPPEAAGRLYSRSFPIGDKYVLEFYESSENRNRYQYHAMGIENAGGVVLYETELGRAPAYPDWIRRRLDLSEYSGQTVRVFFDYAGIGGDTWLLDDFLVNGFDRYLGEGPGDPVIFEQLEIAGHYAVDILPLVDLIDAVFADEVAIKGALDSFINDVANGAIHALARSDIFFAAVDVLRKFPIENIGEFLREEYKIPCGYCEGCRQTPAQPCELDPALVGLTRAEYIGRVLPEVLLGLGAGVIGDDMVDLVYDLLMGIINDFGGGSPAEVLTDLAVSLLTCGRCDGCKSDPPGPCANNKLVPILESLYVLLGVENGSAPAEVQEQEVGDEEDPAAAYYADVPHFFTALWSNLYRAAVSLFGGVTETETEEESAAEGPEIKTSEADDTSVDIPDKMLRKAIGYALLKSPEEITASDLEKLYTLSACDRGITDLTGLEGAENLQFLDLYGNEIADLSPLAGLTGLESLHLSYTGVDDIGALSGLTNLTELDLAHNNITDLSALSGLTGLEILNLNGNAVTSIEPLAGMGAMKRLHLADNDIGSIVALEAMNDLERLNLSGNGGLGAAGFAALAGKSSLERLNLYGTGITGVVPAVLAGLTGLKSLDLGGNAITNLGNLASLTGLETLKIGANDLTDARLATVTWANMSALRHLELADNRITNPAALAVLTDLTKLNLAHNNIANPAALAGLTALESLNLSHNRITDISALDWTAFKALRYLYLAANNDSFLAPLDLSPLGGAATPEEDRLNLVELDLSNNCIDDISALAWVNFRDALWGFKAWVHLGSSLVFAGIEYLDGERGGFLDLSDNYISDTTPLLGKKLQSLDLSYNEISDAHVLEDVTFSGMMINGLLDLSGNLIESMEGVFSEEWQELFFEPNPEKNPKDVIGLDAIILRDNYLMNINSKCARRNIPLTGKAPYMGADCNVCGKPEGTRCDWAFVEILRQNNIIVADEDQKPGPAPQGVITGQIFSPGGEPVEGAGVTAWEEGSGAELQLAGGGTIYRTVTRADGSFRLPLPAGIYRVRIEHAGFNPVEVGGLVIEKTGPTLEKQEIYLEETIGLVSLEGKVVNALGEPLDNLQISLKEGSEKRGGEVLTGEAGSYELQLAAGNHVVEIRRDGYIPATLNITVLEDGTVVGAEETVVMGLLTCEGEVTDVSGEPKTGAEIIAAGDAGNEIVGRILGDGTFTLGSYDELLLPGTYRVESKLARYLPAVQTMTVGADGTIEGWDGAFVMELHGDVSNDGRVDIGDAILALKQIVGLTVLDEKELARARVSGHVLEDGNLSIRDVILVLRYIVGLIDAFPAAAF